MKIVTFKPLNPKHMNYKKILIFCLFYGIKWAYGQCNTYSITGSSSSYYYNQTISIDCSANAYNLFSSSTPITLNLETDFCADKTGANNSYAKFISARDYINYRGGNVTLEIPVGASGQYYLIDPPQPSGPNALFFVSVSNVHVKGIGSSKTQIKYADGINIGYPVAFSNANLNTPGTFITFSNSNYCSVSSLEVDGNRTNMNLLYPSSTCVPNPNPSLPCIPTYNTNFGNYVYDANNNGITIKGNSNDIIIDNVIVKNFHTDGITISPPYPNVAPVPQNITILNSQFLSSGRNNFSWTGGKTITVTNCDFNDAGVGSGANDAPRIGIDIENEYPGQSSSPIIEDGTFTNCRVLNNYGYALHNNYESNNDIKFIDCTFYDLDNYYGARGVNTLGKKTSFNNCKIYGNFTGGYERPSGTSIVSDRTTLINTEFYDSKPSTFPSNFADNFNNYSIYSDGNSILLENCTFTLNKQTARLYLVNTNVAEEDKYFYIKNTSIDFLHTTNSTQISQLQGCIFDGVNHINNSGLAQKKIYSNAIVIRGAASPSSINEFYVDKKIYWNHFKNGLFGATNGMDKFELGKNIISSNEGYLNFYNSGYMYTENNCNIHIGSNALFKTLEGGVINFGNNSAGTTLVSNQIHLGGKLHIGQNVIGDGVGLFHNSIIYKDNTNAELYISPLSNTNTPANIDPFNGSIATSNYFSPNFHSEVCPIGGNPKLPSSSNFYINSPFPTNCGEDEALDFANGGFVKVLNNSKFSLSTSSSLTTQDFSIEVNFKKQLTGTTSGFSSLFSTYKIASGSPANHDGFEFGIYNPNGKIYLQMGNTNLNYSLNYYDVNVNDGLCHHLVMVRRKTGSLYHFYLYLDGVIIPHVNGVQNSINTNTSNDLYFGSRWNSTNQFDGIISHIRYWNRELDGSEVFSFSQGIVPTTNQLNDLVADWDISDGSTTFKDEITSNNAPGILGGTGNPAIVPSWLSSQAALNACLSCQLDLNLFLEGYYIPSNTMANVMLNQNYYPIPASNDVDDIIIELHESFSPHDLVFSKKQD